MQKISTAIVIITVIIYTLTSASISFAAEEPETGITPTATISGEAEQAAQTASLMGISTTVIEGVIFATALGIMAVAISSDSDAAHAHGHGHGN